MKKEGGFMGTVGEQGGVIVKNGNGLVNIGSGHTDSGNWIGTWLSVWKI